MAYHPHTEAGAHMHSAAAAAESLAGVAATTYMVLDSALTDGRQSRLTVFSMSRHCS